MVDDLASAVDISSTLYEDPGMRKLDTTRYKQWELAAEVGRRIRAFRRERHWTQPVLANFLEIKLEWLADYEKGDRLPPVYTIYQLACIFGVSVGSLLDEEPAEIPIRSQELLRVLRRAETLSTVDQRELGEFFNTLVEGVRKFRHD
jgi:transcriptional regulator with XRE-family HTH domain